MQSPRPTLPFGSTTAMALFEPARRFMETLAETARISPGPGPRFATPHSLALDLKTVRLLDYSEGSADAVPILVHAPFAGHTAVIADYHEHQSLMRCLQQHAGGRLYLTDWKSANIETRGFGIDAHLAELIACIDHLGGRVHLSGLCQGGWACAMLAALVPDKVASLVLAGAPLDLSAGDGAIRKTVAALPPAFFEGLVAMGGGVLPGAFMLQGFKNMHPFEQYVQKYLDLYEHVEEPDYRARLESFSAWFEHPLDLPGRWYLQVVEELFRENRLYEGRFCALGQELSLGSVNCPTYLLAGEHDEITPPEQVLNAQYKLATPPDQVQSQTASGGHVGLFMSHYSVNCVWPEIAAWTRRWDSTAR